MTPYVIKQGDYLTQLAHDLGFDKDAVWNDEKNADLKAKRPNVDILYPGDVLYLPDPTPAPSPMAQGTENGYSADIPTVKVTLAFIEAGAPIANQACEVVGLPVTTGTTDGNGEITFDVPVIVREFDVTLTNTDYKYHVLVANVDPPTEESGILQRLTNLGFYRRASEPEDADALGAALSDFQRSSGLPVTGTIDDATRDAIVAAHGS